MTKITVGQDNFAIGAQVPQVTLLVLNDYSPFDTAVNLFIKAVECTGKSKPCLECAQCSRKEWKPSSEVNIFDTDQGLSKEAVLKIKQAAESSGSESGKARVFVISGVEHMSGQAANTLLKFLEETPPGNFFILSTRQITRVLPTIISRASVFAISPDFALFKKELSAFCKNASDLDILLNACGDVGQARRLLLSESYPAFKEACLAMASYQKNRLNRMGLINSLKTLDYGELGFCRRYVFNVYSLPASFVASMSNLDRRPLKVVVADEIASVLEGAQ